MRFTSIYNPIKRRLKYADSDFVSDLKKAVNHAYMMIIAESDYYFQRRRYTLDLTDEYNTGTITITKDSTTVTGAGTTFTSAMVERKLITVDGVAYRIGSFTSTTSIELETAYKGETTSGATYSINQDVYTLDGKCDKILAITQAVTPTKVYEVEYKLMDELYPNAAFKGNPLNYSLYDPTTAASETGTCTLTADPTVTGIGTSWTSALVGKRIRFANDDDEYQILSVTDATNLELTVSFQGTEETPVAFEIDPAPVPRIKLLNVPDDAIQLVYRGNERPLPLAADNDVPVIPTTWHWLLVEGGHYFGGLGNSDYVTEVDRAGNRFEEGKKKFISTYKVTNDKLLNRIPQSSVGRGPRQYRKLWMDNRY